MNEIPRSAAQMIVQSGQAEFEKRGFETILVVRSYDIESDTVKTKEYKVIDDVR